MRQRGVAGRRYRASRGREIRRESRVGSFEWTRNCTITTFEEPTLLAYDVADEADEHAQSRWTFEVLPRDTGCVLSQHFAHVPTGRSTVRLEAEANPDDADRTVAERAAMLRIGMRATLDAIRAVVEDPAGL